MRGLDAYITGNYGEDQFRNLYCEVCGRNESNCECPECEVCGEVGRKACYAEGHFTGPAPEPEAPEPDGDFEMPEEER